MSQAQTIEAQHTAFDLSVSDFTNHHWDKTQPAKIKHYWSGEAAPAGRHAEAQILWSDHALHVRYVCNQTEPLVINECPQTLTKTMYLWDRDVCEIFLAPGPAVPEKYFEFEAAPTGEWIDIGLDWTTGRRQSDWQFSSRMTTAARLEDDRVTLAMRIPWSDRLPKPNSGERWRANLFRCVGKDPKLRYMSWQPTRTPQPFFHVPQAFGWLIFN